MFRKHCFRLAGTLVVAVAAVVGWSAQAEAGLLLLDNFNNTQDSGYYSGSDYGLNDELSTRQSGTYAGTTYLKGGTFTSNYYWAQVNNSGGPGELFVHTDSSPGWVALNQQFQGNVQLSATVDPIAGDTTSDDWVAFGLRGAGATPSDDALPSAQNVGACLLVRSNGGWRYDENGGTGSILTGSVTAASSYDVVMGVLGSNFNAWINGVHVITNQTMGGAGATLTSNYIMICASSHSGGGNSFVDNLEVDTLPIPEPATMVLLSSGLIGLLAYAWRKRR